MKRRLRSWYKCTIRALICSIYHSVLLCVLARMLVILALVPTFLLALLINLILLFASSVLFSRNFVALYYTSMCFTQIFNLHKCNTTYVASLTSRDINVEFIRAQAVRHTIQQSSDNTAMALGDGISGAQYQSLWDRIRSGEGMNWWSKVGRRPSAKEETAIYSTTVTCKPMSMIHLEVL